MPNDLQPGTRVRHALFGSGEVRAQMGQTVVVRFGHGLEECRQADLSVLTSLDDRIESATSDLPLEVVNRTQAEAIHSVNARWGVFARSRIDLLPHQLWVCREVTAEWPFRWLVADDVGLGKTVEAGIILTSLMSQNRINRLLVMCPASLVAQWQRRLRRMFDIRLALYTSQADTEHSDFWHTHSQVVVSLHTLRVDHEGRHERLLSADPWDLIVVDESHHLNADERSGPTLAFELVKKVVENERVRSMVFFTGTPHRGKTFGFLAQLSLLRPDLFDPQEPLNEQLAHLSDVVIRNNKQNVTDLKGERLFQPPHINMETYSYSEEEARFYETLTNFIVRGRAYASSLSAGDATSVMLVLMSMQKLASSSVAAIRKAIRGRLARIEAGRTRVAGLRSRLEDYNAESDEHDADEMARLEEDLVEASSSLVLMEDEAPALQELADLADAIHRETKIEKIVSVVRKRFSGRSVLFFTEYKATQSLLISALISEYGTDSVTFINGDDRAHHVRMPDGSYRTLHTPRDLAAKQFNEGTTGFLVSTEAAGEGVDLHRSCYTLIHVDLPWNPMRLHQRVGRLNRYGQEERVEVLSLRNPNTVESRIWQKLEEKLARINQAFQHVMADPEDLQRLVLGMTSPKVVQGLFADSVDVPRRGLDEWFDNRTSSFGGRDVVEVVKAMVGSVKHFNFRDASSEIPKVDLPALRPFFEAALSLNRRRLSPDEHDGTFSFITPDVWRTVPAVRARYDKVTFERGTSSDEKLNQLIGMGHAALENALTQSRGREAFIASLPSTILKTPMFTYLVRDRVTGSASATDVLYGVRMGGEDGAAVLLDWEVLDRLNELPWRKEAVGNVGEAFSSSAVRELAQAAEHELEEKIRELEPRMSVPEIRPLTILWTADPSVHRD